MTDAPASPSRDGGGRRIVLTTVGSYGDLNPFLGLALALKARGHRPVLATMAVYRDVVERAGVGFHPVRPDGDPDDRALLARVMHPRRGSEYIVREVMMRHLRDTHADLSDAARGADLVVSHPITFAAPIVAEQRDLPWVSTVLAPLSFFSASDLPAFPNAPWVTRVARVPGVARALVGVARLASRPWVREVAYLRRDVGLPPGGHPLFEGQHAPGLVLALFSSVFGAKQPDWPPQAVQAGPVWFNGLTPPTLSPALEHFLHDGPPPVVFTLGTSAVSAPGAFYEESASAAEQAGLRAVLLVGRHAANRPRRALPPTIAVVDVAPHAALMPRAAAIVHQGGAGTLHQALRAGVPMLVVPHAHDQADNAQRAVALGVGASLTPRRYRAAAVAGRLRRLVSDAAVTRRAREVAAIVRLEDGAETGSAAIDALLARV